MPWFACTLVSARMRSRSAAARSNSIRRLASAIVSASCSWTRVDLPDRNMTASSTSAAYSAAPISPTQGALQRLIW